MENLETQQQSAIAPLSKAPPAPLVYYYPEAHQLEHLPTRTSQPTATRGAIALLIGVVGVLGVAIVAVLIAIAMRPQPQPIVTPPPVVNNPKCVAWCGK